MPEYLAPGVFIEEVPARLKAIEGVSTSTAGFVGFAARGPVAGGALPFTMAGVDTPRDQAPALVTSFAAFQRAFGDPLPLPDPGGNHYLGHAVRGFFDNGGKRAYIARVARGNASFSQIAVSRGVILRLARRAPVGDVVVLDSLRGVHAGATPLEFVNRTTNAVVHTSAVTSFDMATKSVKLATALTAPLESTEVYVRATSFPVAGGGPIFWARSQGAWSAGLAVTITPSDRGPVTVVSGGGNQLVVRTTATFYRGASIEVSYAAPGVKTYHVVADLLPGNILQLGSALAAGAPALARILEIDVTIADESSATPVTETYRALAWNRTAVAGLHERHYSTVINTRSSLVYVQPPATEGPGLAEQPTTVNGYVARPSTVGVDGTTALDYVGVDVPPRTALHALSEIEDIRIVAVPGRTDAGLQAALITHCERLRYRFAVLDSVEAHVAVDTILADRALYDTSYAGYYAPWIELADGDRRYLVPPSGQVAGIMARTDVERGVHKAPANEVVRGAVGLATNFTTGEQEILNPRGVNAIRRLEERGIRVWGARTLSSDPEMRYVNVRRFLIFLEASIDRGTQWVVFEPNTPQTWQRVTDSVGAFLNTQWRAGALFGRRAEDAYFVRCDETTMTADDVLNGRLICHIGVAIVRPAEFVIFRIEQLTGFANRA